MTKIAIQFEEEGFYVPLRQCKHNNMVLNDGSNAQTHVWRCADCGYVYGDTRPAEDKHPLIRTREDLAVFVSLVFLAVGSVGFDILYTVSHWGRL